jgi:polysaccharide pyruvyl transferase WcaK-like protein
MGDSPECINVLQVASFEGNIGDNANHNGTRRLLRENLNTEIEYSESEIRKYYQNYKKEDSLEFDKEFARTANKHDIVLIGSGNFFELWVQNSVTGTTVDMPLEVVDAVDVPLVFYGLGCDPHQGVPGENRKKFTRFLEYVLDADNCLVSVRNDGAKQNIADCIDPKLSERVEQVPDGGFFTTVNEENHVEIPDEKNVIGINVVKDMLDTRFPADGPISYSDFVNSFATVLSRLLDEFDSFDIVFFPHIYSDLDAVADVVSELNVLHRRTRVTTAPLLHGEGSEQYVFGSYQQCTLTLGMRFHSNVCPIGLDTPTIGLSSYPQIDNLYQELGIPERVVDITRTGFEQELYESITTTIDEQDAIRAEYSQINTELDTEIDAFHAKMRDFLTDHNVLNG